MIQPAELNQILENAILAPSMLNTQPWKFSVKENQLSVYVDAANSVLFCDPNQTNLYLSVGAVIENAVLAAGSLGYAAEVSYLPPQTQSGLAAQVSFTKKPGTETADPLAGFIAQRVTNRKKYSPRIVLPEEKEALCSCFEHDGNSKLIFRSNEELKRAILIADKIRFSNPHLVREFIAVLKKQNLGVGLNLGNLQFSWEKNLLFDLTAKTWIFLNCFGSPLLVPFYYTRYHLVNTSSIGWFLAADTSKPALLKAGRAMQRILLKATSMDIQTHVINFPIMYLGVGETGFLPQELVQIKKLNTILNREFPPKEGNIVFIFRLGYTKRSNQRTVRKPLSSFMIKHDTQSV